MGSPWRRPAEETEGYPGLSVNDGVQSGSIAIRGSCLPLWSFIYSVVADGWDETEADYDLDEYGYTADDLARFLVHLLEARGEFGRLLLALAAAERQQQEIEEEDTDAHFAQVHPGESICDCGRDLLQPWWADIDMSAPVGEQLRRCLDVLTGGDDA